MKSALHLNITRCAALLAFVLVPLGFAHADSVFDYINTPEFALGASAFYLTKAPAIVQRTNIIAAAQDECGGRYEGTETKIVELSHDVEIDKNVVHTPNPANYKLVYTATSDDRWLMIETIKCSIHEGHMRSVLHASIITGTEKRDVTYTFVNDNQVGNGKVSNTTRTYTLGADQMTAEYKTPYGTVIP